MQKLEKWISEVNQQISPPSHERFDSYLKSAQRFFAKKSYRAALRYVDRALGIDSKNVEALFVKSRILIQSVDSTNDALIPIDLALKQDSKNAECIAQKARVLYNLKKNNESIRLLKKAYRLEPKNYFVLESYGLYHLKLGENKEALQFFKKASKISETSRILNDIGRAYSRLGQAKKGLHFFEKSLKINPNESVVSCNYAANLYLLGNSQKALLLINKYLKNDSYYNFFILKSIILENKKKNIEALKTINDGIFFNRNNIQLLEKKADLNYTVKNYIECLITLEKIIERSSSNLALNLRRIALMHFQLENYKKAHTIIDESLKVESNNNAKFLKIDILRKLNKNKEALSLCNQILKNEKKNIRGLIQKRELLAVTDKSKSKYKKIESITKKIISLDKYHVNSLFSNIDAKLQQGNFRQAYNALLNVSELMKKGKIEVNEDGVEYLHDLEVNLLLMLNKPNESLKKVNLLLKKDPFNEETLKQKIFALSGLERDNEIQKILDAVNQLDSLRGKKLKSKYLRFKRLG